MSERFLQISIRPADARRWRGVLAPVAAALSLVLAACAAIEAPPAPSNVAPAVAAPSAVGAPVSPERKRLIEAFGGEYYNPTTESYLNGVLAKLAPASGASPAPYRVTLLNSPVVNAFALPSGDIFVTRGLLALADDTSEIAAVMAHEIAHITARHAALRAELEKTAALFSRVNRRRCCDQPQAEAGGRGPLEAVDRAVLAPAGVRGRSDRHQGHRQGRLRPVCRGAVPRQRSGDWSALRASMSGASTADRPDMMATHPSTPERIAQAIAEARADRRAGRRRRRPRRLSRGDRRPRLWRRSRRRARARHALHPPEARLRLRRAGGLRAREPDLRR